MTEAALRPPSINPALVRSSATIAGLTLFFAAVSLVREQATAAWFGTGPAADAFVVGYALPAFFITTVSGILAPAFMPLLVEERHQSGRARAEDFLAAAATTALLAGVLMAVLLLATARWSLPALASGFDVTRLALAARVLWLLAPAVAVSSLAYLWTALLNADERYAVGAFAPTLQPAGALVGLLVAPASQALDAMTIGLTVGACAQVALLGWAVRRAGWRLRFSAPWQSPRIHEFRRHYAALFTGALLMGATTLVTQSFATRVSPGAAAHLNFANVGVLFVVGMGARTIGQLVLPSFSARAAAGDWAGLARQAQRAVTFVWWTSVPATIALLAGARILTTVLFERGAFTAADSDVVSGVARILALQIPWYLANVVAVRLLSALQANRVILVVAFLNLVATTTLNAMLHGPFGLAGIAATVAIVYALSFVTCWWTARRRLAAVGA